MILTKLKNICNKDKISGDMNGILSNYLIRKRVDAIRPYLKDKMRILDIGCGIFRWQNLLSPKVEYIGIDYEESITRYNKNHFNYQFFTTNVETDELDFYNQDFDLIIMVAVLEHFNRPDVVLRKLKKMLNSNGILAMTTPHPGGDFILNYGAKIKIFSQDKHMHHKLLNFKAIQCLTDSTGYKIIEYKRFLYGLNQLVILMNGTIE